MCGHSIQPEWWAPSRHLARLLLWWLILVSWQRRYFIKINKTSQIQHILQTDLLWFRGKKIHASDCLPDNLDIFTVLALAFSPFTVHD